VPVLRAKADNFARAGFLTMRYADQLKSSWSYNWGIFREIWDIFTLHNWYWLVVGFFILLCVLPGMAMMVDSTTGYYLTHPEPPFDPSLSQDIITDYYFIIRQPPHPLALWNYYWVSGSGYKTLTFVMCVISVGLLLTTYLRGR